jgi:hypothetical protein
MTAIGLIDLVPLEGDRRRKLVVPTQTMIQQDLVWLDDYMSSLAVLYPDRDDYQPARLHDIRYQRAQRVVSTYFYQNSHDILKVEDPALKVMQRQEAAQILYTYLLAAQAGGNPYLVSLPFEEVASAHLISRTHVRNLLNDLVELKLVEMRGRGGKDVVLTPGLWRIMDYFLAYVMWGHDQVWQESRKLVAQSAQ